MESPASSPASSPTPRFAAASAGTSPLSRNQKLGLLTGAGVLFVLLLALGLALGVKRNKPEAGKDLAALGNAHTPLPAAIDAGRAGDNPGGIAPDAGAAASTGGAGMPVAPGGPAGPETGAAPGPSTPTSPSAPGIAGAGGPAAPSAAGIAITPVLPSIVTPPSPPAARAPKPGAVATARLSGRETYVVRDNDSLWSIARKVYGNGAEWTRIVAANPGLTPQKLHAGMKIRLPEPGVVAGRSGARGSGAVAAAARPAAARLHRRSLTVQEGDTLYNIARKVYGDGEKWDVIYNANKDKLDNPDELPAGTQLTIPAS